MANDDRLSRIESRWSLIDMLGRHFPVVGAVLSGGAAYLTDFMAAWSPLSWFAAALLGWLAFSALSFFASAKRERDERVRRISMLTAPKGQINPLDERFVGQRVHISDLLPPFGVIIADKEFRNCEIIGPANIVMLATPDAGGEMAHCEFFDSEGVITDNQVTIRNGVAFRNCSFRNCKFYKITILMTLMEYRHFRDGMGGLPWLNAGLVPQDDQL